MDKRILLSGFCISGLIIAGLTGCGGGNNAEIDDKGDGTDGTTMTDDGTGTDGDDSGTDDTTTASSDAIVPSSIGGGVSESDSFDTDSARSGSQLSVLVNKREAAGHALRFLNHVRKRFRRVLRVAKRIENAPLTQLEPGTDTGDFTVNTPDGRDVCVRISTAPFSPKDGEPEEGGAEIDADIDSTGEAVSLRVWINDSCSGADADYARFYASIMEARPAEVALESDDDSSENAWRAGRGRAWIIPGALLNVDTDYRARGKWDHTDPLMRRTVFEERGHIGDDIVIEAARYTVIREETDDDTICKKVHAVVDFAEHPRLDSADVRFGLCFNRTEEGREAEQLQISGSFVRNDGTEVVLGDGCFGREGNDTTECDMMMGTDLLDLGDPELVDDSLEDVTDNTELPEESFDDAPEESKVDLDEAAEIGDSGLDGVPVDGDTDGDGTLDSSDDSDSTDGDGTMDGTDGADGSSDGDGTMDGSSDGSSDDTDAMDGAGSDGTTEGDGASDGTSDDTDGVSDGDGTDSTGQASPRRQRNRSRDRDNDGTSDGKDGVSSADGADSAGQADPRRQRNRSRDRAGR